MDEIEIRRPDDFHVHLREGDMLRAMAPLTAKHFARALVMPNLNPPILTGTNAYDYGRAIRAVTGDRFKPLLTIKLTDGTTTRIVRELKRHDVVACKLYPVGVTTNSSDGVSNIRSLRDVFQCMSDEGLVLCLHGETPGIHTPDREWHFVQQNLRWLANTFPSLKIVLEHITTEYAADTVNELGPNVAATITAHHLFITLDDVIGGELKPHLFCKPIAKRASDRNWLVECATSGNPKFFLGTDSAPHPRERKESASCCAGVFTAPLAIPLLAQLFEEKGTLHNNLERFVSVNGAKFYDLPLNEGTLRLVKRPMTVDRDYRGVVPFRAGEQISWSVVE